MYEKNQTILAKNLTLKYTDFGVARKLANINIPISFHNTNFPPIGKWNVIGFLLQLSVVLVSFSSFIMDEFYF